MIIDITNEIFTILTNSITDAVVKLEYDPSTLVFPCITFSEISNTTDEETIDTLGENKNVLIFEVNIFTQGNTKVSDAKKFRNSVDNILSGTYRMTRNFANPTPNYLDESIYRYTLRYNCKIDKNKTIYRR